MTNTNFYLSDIEVNETFQFDFEDEYTIEEIENTDVTAYDVFKRTMNYTFTNIRTNKVYEIAGMDEANIKVLAY